MSASEVWTTIFLLLAATVITRCSFFLLGHRVKMPPRVQHALRYAPAAALAAIVAPDLLLSNGHLAVTVMNPKLMAGIGATAFFMATRHLLGTIIAGMALFTLLRVIM
ncbi:AzlD domain-containing protein [Noviherbaspirillum galbum]|uniref:AzlD domain-containing protein n=1 Tax=Noviherbaspirillum galbum TaxID=2709383 RepID=A0A6B3SMW8_9BURK|nr:AzlD domain-containing protein [Noviherbaspirillum galbum]NEX60675.1 AzlD domain-containing protein [Noviherbaspirillum galbum]